MSPFNGFHVERWTRASSGFFVCALVVLLILAFAPLFAGANLLDKFTTLFTYVLLALMWNLLAGYGGLISVGQQAFFGVSAYSAIQLVHAGVSVYPALMLGGLLSGVVAFVLSPIMLRLRDGEFAVGMWVVAAIAHLLVVLDPSINGETGTSLPALNAYEQSLRRAVHYWLAFVAMVGFLGLSFFLLRSRIGAAIQAIRDNEHAAASVGVDVMATKRLIFIIAAVGCGIAGALWLATSITFQPRTYFGLQWTAYMIFMVIVGGIGTYLGPIIGAVLFFVIESLFGEMGVWYLILLGLTAILFALFLPRGLWGTLEGRFGFYLMPLGYRLRTPDARAVQKNPEPSGKA